MRLRTGARADQEVYLPFFDFENDIVCAKLAEKLQTAYEGLKKKSKVTLVEPEQPKTPKGNEQAAKTGDNMIIGTWLIGMVVTLGGIEYIRRKKARWCTDRV